MSTYKALRPRQSKFPRNILYPWRFGKTLDYSSETHTYKHTCLSNALRPASSDIHYSDRFTVNEVEAHFLTLKNNKA